MYEWPYCHIRNDGRGFEVSFYGNGTHGYRRYDAKPDAIFDSLEAAKDYAQTKARYVDVIEPPPFGF